MKKSANPFAGFNSIRTLSTTLIRIPTTILIMPNHYRYRHPYQQNHLHHNSMIKWPLIIFIILIQLLINNYVTGLRADLNNNSINNNNQPDDEQQLLCPLSYRIEFDLVTNNINYINDNQSDVYFTVFLPEFQCHSHETANSAQKRDSLIYLNAIKYALNLLNNANYDRQLNSLNVSQINANEQINSNNNVGQQIINTNVLSLFPLFNVSNTNNAFTNDGIKYGAKIIYVNHNNQDHVEHLVC